MAALRCTYTALPHAFQSLHSSLWVRCRSVIGSAANVSAWDGRAS